MGEKKRKAARGWHYELVRPVVIIGNPGSGKSTTGRKLAEAVGAEDIDTDPIIEAEHDGKPLQTIADELGYEKFIATECAIVMRTYAEHSKPVVKPKVWMPKVWEPGGSLVRSPEAIELMKNGGPNHEENRKAVFAYLREDLRTVLEAIDRRPNRGIVRKPPNDLVQELTERIFLFEKYADFTIYVRGDRHRAAKELFRVLLANGVIRKVVDKKHKHKHH